MAYTSEQDLLAEFSEPELARLTGDPAGLVINLERIEHAAAAADSYIEAYLHGRYNVPFTEPVDDIIRKIALDLTVANLCEIYFQNSTLPSTVLWRKLNALKLLREVQHGNIQIDGTPVGTGYPPAILTRKGNNYSMTKGFN